MRLRARALRSVRLSYHAAGQGAVGPRSTGSVKERKKEACSTEYIVKQPGAPRKVPCYRSIGSMRSRPHATDPSAPLTLTLRRPTARRCWSCRSAYVACGPVRLIWVNLYCRGRLSEGPPHDSGTQRFKSCVGDCNTDARGTARLAAGGRTGAAASRSSSSQSHSNPRKKPCRRCSFVAQFCSKAVWCASWRRHGARSCPRRGRCMRAEARD